MPVGRLPRSEQNAGSIACSQTTAVGGCGQLFLQLPALLLLSPGGLLSGKSIWGALCSPRDRKELGLRGVALLAAGEGRCCCLAHPGLLMERLATGERPGEWRPLARGDPWAIQGRAPLRFEGAADPGPPAVLVPALLIPVVMQSAALALGMAMLRRVGVWHGLPPTASAQVEVLQVGVLQELPEGPASARSAGCSVLAAGDAQSS